jgi:hypothetical protein
VGEAPASRLRAQVSGNNEEGRGSGEGVEDLIFDSSNDHGDGKASFSESHCLLLVSIDGA